MILRFFRIFRLTTQHLGRERCEIKSTRRADWKATDLIRKRINDAPSELELDLNFQSTKKKKTQRTRISYVANEVRLLRGLDDYKSIKNAKLYYPQAIFLLSTA